jgi:hypothetical protein
MRQTMVCQTNLVLRHLHHCKTQELDDCVCHAKAAAKSASPPVGKRESGIAPRSNDKLGLATVTGVDIRICPNECGKGTYLIRPIWPGVISEPIQFVGVFEERI